MGAKSKLDLKKEQVLQAASEVFARFGFDKTTLDDIGRRAGLNKASLYYYFKNKEEIFIAVVLSETQAFTEDLQHKTLEISDVREKIRFFLAERIRRYGEVLHLTRLSVDNLQRLEPMFDKVYLETKKQETAFLKTLLESGPFQLPAPPEMVAERLFQLSDAVKHDCIRNAGRFVSGEVDFSPAIAQMDFWVDVVLQPA
jgi:AcrR family transcriptional regulator